MHHVLRTTRRATISKLSIPAAPSLYFPAFRYAVPAGNTTRLYASPTSSIDNEPTIPSPQIPLPDNAKTLTLPDGRKMGYAEYGHPTGHPFIFIHGTPDCRIDLTATAKDEGVVQKLNIRLIGIDRPGIGLSSFQPQRTILDWPDDLQHLIRHLKLDSYRIIGISGGTPYTLACAMRLPREELRAVGIVAGAGPRGAGFKGTNWHTWIGLQVWKKAPWVMEGVFNRWIVPTLMDPDRRKTEEMFRKARRYLKKADREVLGSEEMTQALTTIFKEIYRQGSAKGVAEEWKLMLGNWGFELEDVKFEKIRLWYGTKDVNTPLGQGRYMAARLPGSVLKVYEGDSHFTIWEHNEEILTSMLEDK